MKNLLNYFLLFTFFLSCARIETVNMQGHEFNQKPRHVIWFQIAGLSEEHLAMLRFNMRNTSMTTSFEKIICVGQAWSYNLYNLRPNPEEGFLSQVTGSKNIKGDCSDFKNDPIWNYWHEIGGVAGIFESGVDRETSFYRSQSCNRDFLQNAILWRMDDELKNSASPYHYQEEQQFDKGKIYYDKTCQNGVCYTSIANNVKTLWEKHLARKNQGLFIIRDFSYLKALKNKNFSRAREILTEIEQLYSYFQEQKKDLEKTLVLLTSSAARKFEFPSKGEEWAIFEKSGQNVIYRNSSLISPVFALGAGSENFCGIYEESQMLKRALWSPERRFNVKLFKDLFGTDE